MRYTYIIIFLIILSVSVYDIDKQDNNPIFRSTINIDNIEPKTVDEGILYIDIINEYVNFINNNFYKSEKNFNNLDLTGKNVNLELLYNLHQYNQYNVYYALEDLDKNGSKELLIAGSGETGELIYYDLFTFDGKSLINPFTLLGYEFGYRTNFSVYANGIIEIDWSNSGSNSGSEFYKISEDGYTMEQIDSVSLNANNYGLMKYYHDKEENIEI